MFSCFNGLLGPEKKRTVNDDQSDGSGKSPSWATLPVPVSNETLTNWLPVSWLEENRRCVLFFHLGSFDLLSLKLSGCTRRDLLFICEEKLSELQPQASKISVVVDLHHVKLEQLNSHWWKILAPRLLQLVDKRFPGFLEELLFVRANRLSSLAAERLLNLSRPHLRDLIVLGGDEIAAQTFLESRGLGFVADCFFRDPSLTAVEAAHAGRLRLRRCRRCCRFSFMGLFLLSVVLLLESALGLPLSGILLLLDLEGVTSRGHWAGLALFVALAGWIWCPRLTAKETMTVETMQVLILLLGSPVAWAAAYAGHAHYLIAATAPALMVALSLLAIPVPSKVTTAAQVRRKDAWWPEVATGSNGEPVFMDTWNVPPRRQLPAMEGDGKELLGRLMHLSGACRQVQLGSKQVVGDMVIQRIASEEGRAVWSAQLNQDPVMFVASEVHLSTSDPVEAVLWAIYSAEERMKWDSSAFKAYEVLGRQVQKSSQSFCDFLYCRIPLAPGVKDRDMVQERFLMKLPNEQGYAIAIQSCSPSQCTALGLEVPAGVIRARTILSGYILRPHHGGVLLSGVSQTDLGGSVPQWVQGFVKKAGKRMPLQWAERLQDYCNSKAEAQSP